MSIKQALVTGGAGFIGSHVVKSLLERYPDIKVRVMHLPQDNLINLEGLDVELVPGDITRKEDVEKAMQGCDAVFHLAAVYALWLPDLTLMDRVNIGGSRNVFDTCLEQGIKRIVYTSSYAVFGGQGLGVSCTEESPFKLHQSYYSLTKYKSHKLAKEYAEKGLDIVIVCPTAPVGPGDYGPTPTGKLFLDFTSAPVNTVMKSGSNYVDVRDCAMGHLLAYENGRTGESYILGGDNYTVEEVIEALEKVTGQTRMTLKLAPWMLMPTAWISLFIANYITRKPPLLTPADLKTLGMGLWADPSKAERELGLTKRPLQESIHDALKWFIDNGYFEEKVIRKLNLSD